MSLPDCRQRCATKRLKDGAHLIDAKVQVGKVQVVKLFDHAHREIGTTSVLSERAGRNWHKLSPDNRQVVLEAVVAGFRQKDIAANYGISRGYVAMLRIRAGLPSRPRVRQ